MLTTTTDPHNRWTKKRGQVTDEFAKLPLERQKALEEAFQRLKQEASVAAGHPEAIELPVNLTITVTPASKEALAAVGKGANAAASDTVLGSVSAGMLSEAFLAAVAKAEPVVLKALADPQTAALFAVDPVAALHRVSGQVDPEFLKLVDAARKQTAPTPAPPAPGVRLQKITVTVET
jgi:hypothetical protein